MAELFTAVPADQAIGALRQALSLTFREATTPSQLDAVLEEIRFVAAEALVPCNSVLEAIEEEPIAMPTWRRFVGGVDTQFGHEEDEKANGEPT